ncbi:MAG: phage holin family protein [Pirellulaceae bacterium]
MHSAPLNATAPQAGTARQMAGELAQAIQLRRELVDLELRHDRVVLTRFLLVGGIAAAMVLCGVPLLLTAAAQELAQGTQLDLSAWLTLLGTGLVVPGTVALMLGIRRLRGEFCGLQNTLAELREDVIWMQEWATAASADAENASQTAE